MKKLFAILGLLIGSWLCDASAATTRYVSASGNDSNSCAASATRTTPKLHLNGVNGALACMSGGDTLYFIAGTYTNERVHTASLTTIPSGSSYVAATTLAAEPGSEGSVILTVSSSSDAIITMLGAIDYITINGFVFDGNSTAANAIFTLVDGSNRVPQHTTFSNNEVKNVLGSGLLGFQLSRIFGNNIHNNGTNDNLDHGIYIGDDGNDIYNNAVHDNPVGYGIHLYNGASAGAGHIAFQRVHDNIVRNNLVYNNGKAGILLSSGVNNIAHHNIIRDNINQGITTYTGAINTGIYNNTIYNNTNDCISTQQAVNSLVKNNLCNNNSNQISDSGTGTTFATNMGGSAGTGISVVASPTFVNVGNGDFRLDTGSAGIDQGTNIATGIGCTAGSTCVDFAGTVVPQNSLWDIGAYEFIVGSNPPGPLPSGTLVASYALDGNVLDSSGNGLNGSAGGCVTYAAGKYNSGAVLDGTCGITIADNNLLDFTTGFAITGWLKPSHTITSFEGFIVKYPYFAYVGSTGYCGAGGSPLGGYSDMATATVCYTTVFTSGTLYHFAITYDSQVGIIKMFIGGVLITSTTASALLTASSNSLYLGTSPSGENFTGLLDNIRLYNGPLTDAEVITDRDTPIIALTPGTTYISIGAGSTLKCGALSACLKIRGQ